MMVRVPFKNSTTCGKIAHAQNFDIAYHRGFRGVLFR